MVEPCPLPLEQVFLTRRVYLAFLYLRCAICKMKLPWAFADSAWSTPERAFLALPVFAPSSPE